MLVCSVGYILLDMQDQEYKGEMRLRGVLGRTFFTLYHDKYGLFFLWMYHSLERLTEREDT